MFSFILITGIIPLIILYLVLTNVCESSVISTRVKNVSAQFNVFTTYVSKEYEELSEARDFAELAEDVAGIYMSRIQIIDRDFNIITDTYQINRGKLCVSQDVNRCFNGTNSAYADSSNQCIVLAQAVKSSDGSIQYVMFATSSIADIYSALSTINLFAVTASIILVILTIFFAIFASDRLVAPFKKINDVIERIENGNLSENISLTGCTEVETISSSFNVMISKINELEQSRQEFVSNVSHELKTPLTSMKVLSDSLLGADDIPAETYREFMADLSGEIDRENAIISDLLALVALDRPEAELNIAPVDINALISDALKLIKPLAERNNIDLVLESFRPIIADVDRVKLSMAVTNLVENAVKYNSYDGWVHVSLNADHTYFYIKIQDNGMGIPKEAQGRIFDRFYRVDKARSRQAGGSGLGLSITRSIILAHNGEIRLFSEEGQGATFSIQIPLTHTAGE